MGKRSKAKKRRSIAMLALTPYASNGKRDGYIGSKCLYIEPLAR